MPKRAVLSQASYSEPCLTTIKVEFYGSAGARQLRWLRAQR